MRIDWVSVSILPAVLCLSAAPVSAEEVAPKGFHEVLQDARTAFDQLDAITLQLEDVLAASTALVEGRTDTPERAKEELEIAVEDFEGHSTALRASFKNMDDRANVFFKKWEESLDGMNDIDRATSKEMRDDVWKRYRRIADDGAISEVELRPIVSDLRKLLDAVADEADAAGRKSHRASLEELKGRAAKWLTRVRARLDNAEKELSALEPADTGPGSGSPETEASPVKKMSGAGRVASIFIVFYE